MITIRDIRVIATQPTRWPLVVVKVETSEPDLYGVGCATYTQRYAAVVSAIEEHLKPALIGRDVSRIEDIWQQAMVNGYWRNGPVVNNAVSGVDMALWDILGKRAGLPLYELLGGKCREAAAVYVHCNGRVKEAVCDQVRARIEEGYHYTRVQMGGYGGLVSGDRKPEGALDGVYYDPRAYCRNMLEMMTYVREQVGEAQELLHDVHERLSPIDAVGFAKDVEPLKLFFLEDILAPEDNAWFEKIRAVCTTPIPMGELFVHPLEWRPLVENRLIDFVRMHISTIGGITPARRAAEFCEAYGVRTAWHGPGDVSPIGHAANLHLDLWAPNFGIQEWCRFDELVYEMFPGLPEVRRGYMYPNDSPGLGIDIDESLAMKYPAKPEAIEWTQTRLPDGTPARP